MDISEIRSFLEDNDLSDVEEVKQEDDYVLVKFYYDFDKEELMAAKSYSNIKKELAKREADNYEWVDGGEMTKDAVMLLCCVPQKS